MVWVTRESLRADPDTIYVFGDNLVGEGFGGQARACRGEPNAMGIPTKKRASKDEDAYFTDEEYEANVTAINRAVEAIKVLQVQGRKIVVLQGIGEGLAALPQRAPMTYTWLLLRLAELRW